MTIALGVTVMDAEDKMIGQPVELLASRRPGAEEMDAYERVLGDAMAGDAHAVRARGLRRGGLAHRRSGAEGGHAGLRIRAGHLGTAEVEQTVAPPGGWHEPGRDRLSSRSAADDAR